MGIKSNKSVIDFEFECKSLHGEDLVLPLRFYYHDDYGPVVAVLNDDKEPLINLPASMFSEVSEHLQAQGVIEGKKISQPTTFRTPMSPRVSLPKPVIIGPSKKNPIAAPTTSKKSQGSTDDPITIDLEGDDGKEDVFVPESLSNLKYDIDGATPTQSLLQPSVDDMAAMMAQREQAKQKQSNKKIKSLHPKDQE